MAMKETDTGESKMRKDYLDKEDYYMGIAVLSSQRSKDPVTQVGACIVNQDGRVVGIGYNGMINKVNDEAMPWEKQVETQLENKDMYVCHAEMNAFVNKYAADVRGCSMYVSSFPCNECAKLIVQMGIKIVIYNPQPESESLEAKYAAAKLIFKLAGTELREQKAKKIKIEDESENTEVKRK